WRTMNFKCGIKISFTKYKQFPANCKVFVPKNNPTDLFSLAYFHLLGWAGPWKMLCLCIEFEVPSFFGPCRKQYCQTQTLEAIYIPLWSQSQQPQPQRHEDTITEITFTPG